MPAYPCPPGQVVAASATIFVHLEPDAKLLVDGKLIKGKGPMRLVTTGTIPLGKELEVTLQAESKGTKEDEGPPRDPRDPGPVPPPGFEDAGIPAPAMVVTKKISVRPYQVVNVKLTAK